MAVEGLTNVGQRSGTRGVDLAIRRRRRSRLAPSLRRDYFLRRAFVVGDLLALGSAVAFLGYVTDPALSEGAIIAAAAVIPLWVPIGVSSRVYPLAGRGEIAGLADEVGPVFTVATIWSWLVLIATAIVDTNHLPLLPLLGLWASSIGAVLTIRCLIRILARSRSWYIQRALVIGDAPDARRVISRIARHPEWGLEVIGTATLSDRGVVQLVEDGAQPLTPDGIAAASTAGSLDAVAGGDVAATTAGADGSEPRADARTKAKILLDWVGSAEVARVIFASHPGTINDRTLLARALTASGVQVDLVPGDSDILGPSGEVQNFEGLPVVSLLPAWLPRSSNLVKRVFDLAVAIPLLVLVSPLLLYCAIRIKLESEGPVLFRQHRIGLGRKPFEVLKLRTMTVDAEQRLEEVAALSLHGCGPDSGMFKAREDPRVMKFGAWLRRWSIDEMPQLVNVIKGEMSLVGPRPLPPAEDRRVGSDFEARYQVRPGMTGRWQVLGRSDIPFDDMVRLDYTYVTRWSFAEDVKLLLRTIPGVLGRRGAY